MTTRGKKLTEQKVAAALALTDLLYFVQNPTSLPLSRQDTIQALLTLILASIDADDIDDSASTNKFATAAQLALIASAIQAADLGTAAYEATSAFATAAQGALADSALQPGTLVGTILPYAGATAPSKYLLCYGQNVNRTTQASLFAVIGTTFGAGDGSTTFGIPDLRGRTVFGKDDMGGSAASRLTSAISGVNGAALGAAGGDQRQQAHTHTYTAVSNSAYLAAYGVNYVDKDVTTANTGSTGAGNSQNVPPAIVVNWIIYAGV